MGLATHQVKLRGNILIEFRASPRCFRAPRQHSMFKTKREGLRSWELLRCHRAPRRPFDAIKNMPPLRHRQVMKSYPRRNNHALLVSLTGNPSVFDEQRTTVASLADKEVMPCSAFAKEWRFENEANRSFGKTKGATPPR